MCLLLLNDISQAGSYYSVLRIARLDAMWHFGCCILKGYILYKKPVLKALTTERSKLDTLMIIIVYYGVGPLLEQWSKSYRLCKLNLQPWLNLKVLDSHSPTCILMKMPQLGYLHLASPGPLPTINSNKIENHGIVIV